MRKLPTSGSTRLTMQPGRPVRNSRTPYRRIQLEERVERHEKAPRVLVATAFTPAGDTFVAAWAAKTSGIADLANVPIDFDCKNREDTHHDRLDEEGLDHTMNCMHRGYSNGGEPPNMFEETENNPI